MERTKTHATILLTIDYKDAEKLLKFSKEELAQFGTGSIAIKKPVGQNNDCNEIYEEI